MFGLHECEVGPANRFIRSPIFQPAIIELQGGGGSLLEALQYC